MNVQDATHIHAIITEGAAAIAEEVGREEARRLGGVLEGRLLETLDPVEHAVHYSGCDSRLDALMAAAAEAR